MSAAPWNGNPWIGRLVVRGPRGIETVEQRLAGLDGTRVDGRRLRVKRRGDRVRVWAVSSSRFELAGPVVEGRLVERAGAVEFVARVRPTLFTLLLAAYWLGLAVAVVVAAVAGGDVVGLAGTLAVTAFGGGLVLANRRTWREGLAAAEDVLCGALAGQVVERRGWGSDKGASTSG